MKRNVAILLTVLLGAGRLFAAEAPQPPMRVVPNDAAAEEQRVLQLRALAMRGVPNDAATEEQKRALVRFDLDFPGGSPGDLVAAISKASGHPLNAIIPPDDQDVSLPPLKMRHVDVVQIFDALEASSLRTVARLTGTSMGGMGGMGSRKSWDFVNVGYGFHHQGGIDADTVWSFRRTQPAAIPLDEKEKVCRFYQINPYLKDHSIESITTAIETGWKMLKIAEVPAIKFHKDTGLLIAVGEPDQLQVIEQVLRNLERPQAPTQPGTLLNIPPVPPKPDAKPDGQ